MLKVLVVMGSDSDYEQLKPSWEMLGKLGVPFEVRVASAHRTPDVVHHIATGAREAGFGVVIAAAGGAAHLAGVFAALTTLPVVAVPIHSGALAGVDALLSSVQMPPGIPIAAVGIGSAANAGLFAAAILGAADETLAARIAEYRRAQHERVVSADARIRELTGSSS
jgi:5-(carboxyamino)imidazole ribonucleotide mutase